MLAQDQPSGWPACASITQNRRRQLTLANAWRAQRACCSLSPITNYLISCRLHLVAPVPGSTCLGVQRTPHLCAATQRAAGAAPMVAKAITSNTSPMPPGTELRAAPAAFTEPRRRQPESGLARRAARASNNCQLELRLGSETLIIQRTASWNLVVHIPSMISPLAVCWGCLLGGGWLLGLGGG